MRIEEVFGRHPRPQAPSIPIHGELITQNDRYRDNTPTERVGNLARKDVEVGAIVRQEISEKHSTASVSPSSRSTDIPPVPPPMAHLSSSRRLPSNRVRSRTISPPSRVFSPRPNESKIHIHETLPWTKLKCLGTIVQGSVETFICLRRDETNVLSLLKESSRMLGCEEARLLGELSHPNVIHMLNVFTYRESCFIELEYCRFTLEEVLNVHIDFEEPHLRLIAHSIFAAIRHISSFNIVHGDVSGQSVRICAKTMQIKLSDFSHAKTFSTRMPNTDLEQLGLLLLQCMDGRNAPRHTDVQHVRQQRALNKVFGLTKPESWSGANQLVDFLDDLFNIQKEAATKIEKPHAYIREDASFASLYPFVELAPLECFALWTEAE